MSDIRATLIRAESDDKQTLGHMICIDKCEGDIVFQSKTLELPWLNNRQSISCIPKGVYTVVERYSQKYKNHYHITNVEGRKWILIHHGNYHTDIRGCILLGRDFTDINGDGYRDVTSSKRTCDEFLRVMPPKFELEII